MRAEAQRELESTTDRLRESERRVDELRRQHGQELARHRRRAAELQATSTNLSSQVDEARAAVDALESAVQEQRNLAASRVEELGTELDAAQQAREEAETKLKEMAAIVERLGAAVAGGAERGATATDIYGQALSSTAAGLSSSSGGRSYAEFYADYARRELELAEAKQEQSRLQGLLDGILADIDESGPRLRRQREELDEVRAEGERLHAELAAATTARKEAETARDSARAELASSSAEVKALGSQVSDLTLQVRILTRELAIQDDPQLRFEPFDDENAAVSGNDEDGIQAVITSNLTAFRKLPQLVEQNKRLLRISRELGNKLEDLEGRVRNTQATTTTYAAAADDPEEDDIEAALKSITSLTSEVDRLKAVLKDTQAQASAYKKERDLFSRMIADVRVNGGDVRFEDGETDTSSLEPVRKNMLEAVNKAFEDKHNALNLTIAELQDKLSDASRDAEKARADASNALSLLRDERSQVEGLRRAQVQDKTNLEHVQQSLREKDGELQRVQHQIHKLNEDLNARSLETRRIQTELDMARGEKAMLESMASKANADFTTLLQEKATMAQELSTRKLIIENTATETNMKIASYESMNNSLQQDLAGLRDELAKAKEAYRAALDTSKDKARVAEIEALKARVAELESQAKLKEEESAQKVAEMQKLVDDAKAAEVRKNQIGLKFKSQMETARAALAAKEQEHGEAIEALKSQVSNLVAEVDAAKASLATKDAELSSKQAELTALQKQSAEQAQSTTSSDPSPELQSRIDGLVKQEESLRSQLAASESRVSQLNSELEAKTRALTEAQSAPKEATAAPSTADMAAEAERTKLIETLQKDKDTLTARLTELESELNKARSELFAARAANLGVDAASSDAPATSPAPDAALASLQAEFDTYRAKQEELYEKNVRQVNNANKNLMAKVKRLEVAAQDADAATPPAPIANGKSDEDVKAAVEEALKKQRAELQAETPAVKQESGGYTEEQVAAIRAEYEKSIAELKAKITQLEQQVEHWTKEFNSQKEIASKALLKASLFDKQKKATPKPAANAQATTPAAPTQSAAPNASAANPASLPSVPPAPANNAATRGGMNIAGRGGRGGRGGARGGAQVAGRPATRGGMTPAAVLAAVEAKQGKGAAGAAPKRRASETANGDGAVQQADAGKRVKLDETPAAKQSGDQQQPPPS